MARCEATVTSPGRENTGKQCARNAVRGTTSCERHGGVEEGEQRGLTVSHERDSFRQRCTSNSIRTGEPCKKWAIRGGFVCRTHGGNLPSVQQAARKRLVDLLPLAVQRLQTILESPETADGDALRAVGMLLDRTGMGPQSEVTLELKPWEKLFATTTQGGVFRQVEAVQGALPTAPPTYVRDHEVIDAVEVEVPEFVIGDLVQPPPPVAPTAPALARVGSGRPPRGSRLAAQPARTSRR